MTTFRMTAPQFLEKQLKIPIVKYEGVQFFLGEVVKRISTNRVLVYRYNDFFSLDPKTGHLIAVDNGRWLDKGDGTNTLELDEKTDIIVCDTECVFYKKLYGKLTGDNDTILL